jgi:hypothetical protein
MRFLFVHGNVNRAFANDYTDSIVSCFLPGNRRWRCICGNHARYMLGQRRQLIQYRFYLFWLVAVFMLRSGTGRRPCYPYRQ